MAAKHESEKLILRLWLLTHRTHDAIRRCEDKIFGEYGLTAEHYAVLSTMKFVNGPVRPTDLAHWLERSTNSVSMLADRMVKAGLLRRTRDRADRRVVWLVMTNKAEEAIKPAILAGWDFIHEILSQLPDEDKRAFVGLLETVKYQALKHLNPGVDIEEVRRNEITDQAKLTERLLQYISSSAPEAKRQRGEKGKTR